MGTPCDCLRRQQVHLPAKALTARIIVPYIPPGLSLPPPPPSYATLVAGWRSACSKHLITRGLEEKRARRHCVWLPYAVLLTGAADGTPPGVTPYTGFR